MGANAKQKAPPACRNTAANYGSAEMTVLWVIIVIRRADRGSLKRKVHLGALLQFLARTAQCLRAAAAGAKRAICFVRKSPPSTSDSYACKVQKGVGEAFHPGMRLHQDQNIW